jgi:tellurite resistance protein TerC
MPRIRDGEKIDIRHALFWSLVWISSAFIFGLLLWVYYYYTASTALANKQTLNYFAGYLIEKSLSLDNLFAFYLIFTQLAIPVHAQRRVFRYGIWSAVVLRVLLILFGIWLIHLFAWVMYILGAFLLFSGVQMFFIAEKKKELANSKFFQWLKKHIRLTEDIKGEKFFLRKNKLLYGTPLFLALILVEFSDIVFALDSVPAIFAITTDPFIVWTSNVFAIIGLRSLYFLLASAIQRLNLLKYGIALILIFVGLKMVISPFIPIDVVISLAVIISLLLLFSLLSVMRKPT